MCIIIILLKSFFRHIINITTLYYQKTHDQRILHNYVYLTEDKWTTASLSTIDEMTSARDSLTSTNSLNTEVNTDQKMCKLDTRNNEIIMIVSIVTIVVSMVTSCCIVVKIYIVHNKPNKQDVSEERSSAAYEEIFI